MWWRDDDAVKQSPALRRLLKLSDRYDVPLTLAVIPAGDCRQVAAAVGERPRVRLAQHGVDHRNRREPGSLGEFPLEWTRADLSRRLAEGWAQLADQPGAVRVFVPPWNNVHPELPAALAQSGYIGWSAAGGGGAGAGPPRFDADLDILSWSRRAHFKGLSPVLRQLTQELASRRQNGRWADPIGLITHHRDHDVSAWLFLESWLAWTRRKALVEWTGLDDLIAQEAGIAAASSNSPPIASSRRRPGAAADDPPA